MICQRTWMAVPSFSSHDARDRWFKVGSVRLFLRSVRDDLIYIYIYIYFSIFGRTHQADTYIETWYNQDPIFGIMPCLLVCFCPSLYLFIVHRLNVVMPSSVNVMVRNQIRWMGQRNPVITSWKRRSISPIYRVSTCFNHPKLVMQDCRISLAHPTVTSKTSWWPFPSVTPGGVLVRWALRWPFPAAGCHATGAGSMGFFGIFFTWFNHQGWKKMEILNMEKMDEKHAFLHFESFGWKKMEILNMETSG